MIRVLTYDGHMTGAADKAPSMPRRPRAVLLPTSRTCWTAASMPA